MVPGYVVYNVFAHHANLVTLLWCSANYVVMTDLSKRTSSIHCALLLVVLIVMASWTWHDAGLVLTTSPPSPPSIPAPSAPPAPPGLPPSPPGVPGIRAIYASNPWLATYASAMNVASVIASPFVWWYMYHRSPEHAMALGTTLLTLSVISVIVVTCWAWFLPGEMPGLGPHAYSKLFYNA